MGDPETTGDENLGGTTVTLFPFGGFPENKSSVNRSSNLRAVFGLPVEVRAVDFDDSANNEWDEEVEEVANIESGTCVREMASWLKLLKGGTSG